VRDSDLCLLSLPTITEMEMLPLLVQDCRHTCWSTMQQKDHMLHVYHFFQAFFLSTQAAYHTGHATTASEHAFKFMLPPAARGIHGNVLHPSGVE
jgi:hypothetical protein